MTTNTNILILSADTAVSARLTELLASRKYRVKTVTDSLQIWPELNSGEFDLVIMANTNEPPTPELIARIRLSSLWLETLVMTGTGEGGRESELISAGAFDCLDVASDNRQILLKVTRALERCHMRRELTTLRQQVAMNYGFDNIVGLSEPITRLKETIARIAPTDITMLLTGPAGTGKELIANVIHYHSRRRRKAMITIDCSAVPPEHFNAHLFGETGEPLAAGALLPADSGTLFLNEIDKMPASAQELFLEFLKTPTVSAPESTMPVKLNIRIVAATDKDLTRLIKDGLFNEELFGRLNVLPLKVPGLAERPDDIQMLTEYFLRRLAREMDQPSFTVSRRVIDMLLNHNWPGNVRELENTLKRATALCRGGHLDPDDIIFIDPSRGAAAGGPAHRKTILVRRNGLLDESQKSVIQKALEENDWNFSQTAQDLGIGRTTLWRKVKKYNLIREEVGEPAPPNRTETLQEKDRWEKETT